MKQNLNLGTVDNDGNGDSLKVAGGKINNNINEIYNSIGNGTSLNDINGEITTITTNISSATGRISTLESSSSLHETRITTSESNITQLQSDVISATKITHNISNSTTSSAFLWIEQNGIHSGNKSNTTFYLYRGFTYTFKNNSSFDILFVQKGTGATHESGIDGAPLTIGISSSGTLNYRALTGETVTFSIPFNAATGNNYKYYNSVNGGMIGDIYIL